MTEIDFFDDKSLSLGLDFMKKNDWNLEIALNNFFNNSTPSSPPPSSKDKVDAKKIRELFSLLQEKDEEKIAEDGTNKLVAELGLDPDDIVVFLLSWQLGAKNMGEFTKEEFTQGMTQLRCDSIKKLKERLPGFRALLVESKSFKDFYQWIFDYSKGTQKCLDIDVAIELWQMLLKDKSPHLELWFQFLKEEQKGRGISKDTWNLLLDFFRSSNSDFSNYDSDGAWPTMIDSFVDFAKPKLKSK